MKLITHPGSRGRLVSPCLSGEAQVTDLTSLKSVLWRVLLCCVLLLASPAARAAEIDRELGRHFILLIDDSGDMRRFAGGVREALPGFFFQEGQGRSVTWPAFDPDRDVLSAFFFTIYTTKGADACKASGRQFSALPEAVLEEARFEGRGQIDPETFRRSLNKWLDLPCRWGGKFSPIISAPTMALTLAAKHIDPQARFSSTVLVVVTNDFYGSALSPAVELRTFKSTDDGRGLQDIPRVEQDLVKILPRFRFDLPEGWSREVKARGELLYVRAFRVQPVAPTPEALVIFSPQIELDRVAISSEKVEWQVPRQGNGDIRLASADGLVPIRLDWRIHDGREKSWVLGNHQVPAEWKSLDLSNCEPACSRVENAVVVPLNGILSLPLMAPSDGVSQNPGVVEFRAEFHFVSGGLYDLLYPKTAVQQIELRLAPVQVLPPSWPEPARPITNDVLADLWSSGDGNIGLTQAVALDRLHGSRERRRLGFIAGALALGAMVVFLLFRTAYQRRFAPTLDWQPAGPISLDLSQPGASRLLVGTVGVVNQGDQPWFGRLLRHDEQPTREAALTVDPIALEPLGFRVTPGVATISGFLRSEDVRRGEQGEAARDAEIVSSVRRSVSHGQRVPVFIATEALADFEISGRDVKEALVKVESAARLRGPEGSRDTEGVVTPTNFTIRVMPEVATTPKVSFEPARGRMEFRQGEEIEVGHFVFESQARHRFAVPFESDYELEVLRDRAPLGGRALRLSSGKIRVGSHERRRVAVLLSCDGELVRNPDSTQQRYAVRLLGPCHPDSKQGPHEITLNRDSTRAEAEIQVSYLRDVWDLHQTAEGEIELRCTKTGRTLRAIDGALRLEGEQPFRIPPEAPPPLTLVTLRVGNSGRSGRGRVTVDLERRLEIDADVAACLHLHNAAPAERLLVCYREHEEAPFTGNPGRVRIGVAEGEEAQERTIKLDGELVQKIDGARLAAEKVRAVLKLHVHIVDDKGGEKEWDVDLLAHVGIEKLPGLNWLCIDFGTSAIAAALGRADGDVFHRLDLQNLEVAAGQSLATVDRLNIERNNPYLPSWVICDGDLRLNGSSSAEPNWPAGFPVHRTESIKLLEPGFVGVPALFAHLTELPGRLVFSLKQWLSRLAPSVRLGDLVRFCDKGGEERRSHLVPLDEILEATFAALVVSYLTEQSEDGGPRTPRFEVDQIVLTHPNTFTARHCERFHQIATRVFQRRLGIVAPEHVALLSESDAVAYAYCSQKVEGSVPLGGTERILVYDFGAGTLDLSLVSVQWREDRCQPQSWTIEARLGLPLAGNYLDEILMRLIHEQLQRPELLKDTGTEYHYPVVASHATKGDADQHRNAVLKTWTALRDEKHDWGGIACLDVVVGHAGGLGGVLLRKTGQELNLPTEPLVDEVALYLEDSRIRLSIPASCVHSSRRILDFLGLVTNDAVGELLAQASLQPAAVNTLLVSGRGALWPGLQDRVHALLPNSELVEPGDALRRKDVVPQGAIAFQALRHRLNLQVADRARPRLGIMLGQRHLVPESAWADGSPVDLTGFDEFRLVQISLRHPDAENDLRTLRRYFYVDLTDTPIRRQTLWHDDPRLFIEINEHDGHLRISLKNAVGQTFDIDSSSGPLGATLVLPWPMGSFLLEPES